MSNNNTFKLSEVLKTDKTLEKYGMSDETILDLVGEDTFSNDYREDVQHFIDNAKFELDAICAEAEAEFGC